ncbi:MAG: STAS domain-containing protein [Planctomycetota bacterium]|nr:STAS domain-containing protein [Planctomycetota bacterium]
MNHKEIPFSIEYKNRAVLATVGSSRLGFEELDSFGKKLIDLAEEFPKHRLILDMGLVVSISSIIIGKIFRVRKLLLDSGGALILVAANPSVLHVFNACHLDHLLKIFSSAEQALSETSDEDTE